MFRKHKEPVDLQTQYVQLACEVRTGHTMQFVGVRPDKDFPKRPYWDHYLFRCRGCGREIEKCDTDLSLDERLALSYLGYPTVGWAENS
jgi:hypothetical protein